MNSAKMTVLEDRIMVLDKLDALLESNPYVQYYEVGLGDFPFTGGPSDAKNCLDRLQIEGVASFIFVEGLSAWNFWDMPVRIRNINRTALKAAAERARSELDELLSLARSTAEMRGQIVPSGTGAGVKVRSRPSLVDRIKRTSPVAKVAAATIGSLASVAIILTFLIQYHLI